jgi:hypothetical protein
MVGTRNVLGCLMAFDRPDDFESADTRSERDFRAGLRGGDVPRLRAEPTETRSRSEYYEVLRAADDDSSGAVDSRVDQSGWDSVEDRPPAEDIQVSPERKTHILDGDPTGSGGGHRHGTGRPGKTEFPASWDDEKIIEKVTDVARKPDRPPTYQDWDTWLCVGTRDEVNVWAVVERNGNILTGWPEEGGPGVVRNPRRGKS